MKHTLLNFKQAELLEDLIAKYGQVVSSSQIYDLFAVKLGKQQVKNMITQLVKHGWLIRIKRSCYEIASLSSRGFSQLSPYKVANLLAKNSYVSFATALNYYGFFNQLTSEVLSLSLKRQRAVKIDQTTYSFVQSKADYFFGWQEVEFDQHLVKIARPEKALIDLIHFHRSRHAVDLVIEVIRDQQHDLCMLSCQTYLAKMSITTIKIFGLIFDLLGIDSSALYDSIEARRGTHRMFADADKFNAKWRLYYDSYFDRYQSVETNNDQSAKCVFTS